MIQKSVKIFITLFTFFLLSMIVFLPENIFHPFEFFEWSFEVGVYLIIFIIAIYGSFMDDEHNSNLLFLYSLLFAFIINTNYLVTNTGYSFVYYSFAYFFVVAGFVFVGLNTVNIIDLLTDIKNYSLNRVLGIVSLLFVGLLYNTFISYSYYIYISYCVLIVSLILIEISKISTIYKNRLYLFSLLFAIVNLGVLIIDIYSNNNPTYWIYGITVLAVFIVFNWIFYIFVIQNMFVSFQEKFINFFSVKKIFRMFRKKRS